MNTDIVERLGDFDNHGLTATERFKMRMDAHREIKALRTSYEAACLSIGSMQLRLMAAESEVAILRAERDAAARERYQLIADLADMKASAMRGEAAARDMRERCIKIVDDHTKGMDNEWNRNLGRAEDFVDFGVDIMDAIRALSDAPAVIATDRVAND